MMVLMISSDVWNLEAWNIKHLYIIIFFSNYMELISLQADYFISMSLWPNDIKRKRHFIFCKTKVLNEWILSKAAGINCFAVV